MDPFHKYSQLNSQMSSLPQFELDEEFPRIRLRMPSVREDLKDCLAERDKKQNLNIGFFQILKEIFQYRFLDSIERDNLSRETQGIIVITDKLSKLLMEQSLSWLMCKRFGISCIFDINDCVLDKLSSNLHVIYLVNLVHLSDVQFKLYLRDIQMRVFSKASVYLTHVIDPFDRLVDRKVKALQIVLRQRRLPSPWIVGAFNVVNPWIALLDGENTHLTYLKDWIKNPRTSQISSEKRLMAIKMAFRLVNVFEQMNQDPAIRFQKSSFSDHNQTIATLVSRGLSVLRKKRRSTDSSVDYRKEFMLLIIDRSSDLITPLLHANDFQAFVLQEINLDLKNFSSDVLDPAFRKIPIVTFPSRLLQKTIDLKANYSKMKIEKKESATNFVYNFSFLAKHIVIGLESGYNRLLEEEKLALKSFNSTRSEKISNTQESPSKIPYLTAFDLLRLQIINKALGQELSNQVLKELSPLSKFTLGHRVFATKFSNLVKTLLEINETKSIGLPIVPNIIELYYKKKLSTNLFPFVESKSAPHRPKLCIFIVGGMSYNEVQYAGPNDQHDVTLISSSFLDPKTFLSALS